MNINGYRIIYIHGTKDITSIHAYVKTGSMCEVTKEAGISHLLEHTVLDSWERCKGNCTNYWSKKGVISNAQTLALYTRYYIVGLTKEIDNMINYMASIITNPKFDNKCVERSKKAIKDELLIKINNPEWKLYHTFFSSIADDTSINGFGRVGDYPLQIKNLDIIDKNIIYDYYEKWYRPNNIFFVVVSNKPVAKINACFSKYLHKRPFLDKIVEPTLKCINCTSIFYRKDAEKTSFVVGFINNTQGPTDYLYYTLIQDMLTGDTSSLLYRILRDKLNLVYGIKLFFDMNSSYILSMFEVNCQFNNAKKLINTLLDTLKYFVAGKFDNSLLNRSKERLTIVDMNNCKDNTEYLSTFYANQYMMSKKVNITPDEYIKAVNKITKSQLLSVIRRLFQFDKMLVVCETKNKS
jgi:predicted Zn-dependent peptidase